MYDYGTSSPEHYKKYLKSLKPNDILKLFILLFFVSKELIDKDRLLFNSTVEQSFKGEATKNFNEIFRKLIDVMAIFYLVV